MISTIISENEMFVRERTLSNDSTSSDEVPVITVDHVSEFEEISSNQSSFDSVDAGEPKSHDEDPGKDSGVETGSSGEDDFPIPDTELMAKIIGQVEFYFSDANILKDPFLLKHVKRNKEGYVSLKLLASFRKVKTFTKNWKVVAYSLKHSEKLEVNELGTKVHRRDPLPINSETAPLRTVIALNLPFEKPTLTDVEEMVSKFGEILLIRILKPDSPLPPDAKRYLSKCPEIRHVTSALVEFKTQEGAIKTVQEMDGKNNWRGFKVIPLVQPEISKDSQHKPIPTAKKNPFDKDPANAAKKRKNKRLEVRPRTSSDFAPSSCSESEQCSPGMRRRSNSSVSSGYLSSSPRQTMDYFSERRNSGRGNRLTPASSPCTTRRNGDSETSSPRPWVQRRFILSKDSNSSSTPYQLVSQGVVAIREPRGPDGSNGFKTPRTVFTRPVISPLVTVSC